MGEMVRYLESQSIPAVEGAGIVGNLTQESGLNPIEPGYGLAQWNPSWWAAAARWIGAHGQNPNTAGGQLMYIAANVNDDVDGAQFYSRLGAGSGARELCAGGRARVDERLRAVLGRGPTRIAHVRAGHAMHGRAARDLRRAGVAGSRRLAERRRRSALVSTTPNGACNATFALTGSIKGYTNPFQKATGLAWERTDQGVDVAMQPGSPLLAFAPSEVELIVADFYAGEPAVVSEVTAGPLAGKWWYLSEQIQPTVSPGQTIAAGQTIATYAPAGTAIEIGWWRPHGGQPLGHPGYEEGLATNAGGDFRFLLRALGADPGTGAGLSSGPTIGNSYYPTGNPGP